MNIIAESSSTRTEWVAVDGTNVVEHAFTKGINPFFQTRREISHCIRLELPEAFFKKRWDHVYFYGAGCTNIDKKRIIEASLIAQFKTPVTVESDLLGAARGLLVNQEGIACILGTGSNSCVYDGTDIVRNITSGGFILGDEGSGSALGKLFLGDCLKNLAPRYLIDEFYEKYSMTPDMVMTAVYSSPFPNRSLSTFSFFLSEHLDDEYVESLVRSNFASFIERNILQYGNYRDYQIAFVGSCACLYEPILRDVASQYDMSISKIVRGSMPGLIQYHNNNQ